MKRDIVWTTKFKKDYKLAMKRHMDIGLLDDIIRALSRGEKLPEKNKDHELTGDWVGHRECHIQPDWLLIYRIEDDVRVLPPYRETCTAVFLCAKGVTKHDTPVRGRQSAVPFTVPAPGRGACPVPAGPAARRFCGAVPRLSAPPAWPSCRCCPPASGRPAGRSRAAIPWE